MNKAQLVAAMAENAGMTKKDAEKALAAFEEVVTTSLQKGEKIQLVGFDDISFATLLSPELTTICQPVREMAKKAVELIVNNELTGMTGGKFVFPVSLVVRQTTKKRGEPL